MSKTHTDYTVYYVGRAQFYPPHPIQTQDFWAFHSEFARTFIMDENFLVVGDANTPDELKKDLVATGPHIAERMGPIIATGYLQCGLLMNLRLTPEEDKGSHTDRAKRIKALQDVIAEKIPKPSLSR